MEVDKQLKFKSQERMQVEFISNNVDVMTHHGLSSVALALRILIIIHLTQNYTCVKILHSHSNNTQQHVYLNVK